MCMPILIYYFGSISIVSIVANVLILPTIPIAMGLVFLTGAVGFLPSLFLLDWLKYVVKTITTLLLDYHIYVMEFFSKQTSLIISFEKENALVFLMYLPIAILVAVYYTKRIKQRKQMQLKVWSNPRKYLPFGA